MRAMVLKGMGDLTQNPLPLELQELPKPIPNADQVLLRVSACGVCHTELDEIEGRTPPAYLPIVLGHQVVGTVHESGAAVSGFNAGDRVGVAWIYSACGRCDFCLAGNENLCREFKATGRDADGGYAEFMTVPAAYVYRVPDLFTDLQAAPLLCAGAIGYRSLSLGDMNDGKTLGLTGFGASAHLVLKLAQYLYPRSQVFVFARSQDEQEFARELGAAWAGTSSAEPPELCHCIIDTTPAWTPIVDGLKNLERGGRLVINAIRKEGRDIDALLRLDYPTHLWMEKELKSVANVARSDVAAFLELAATIPVIPEVEEFPLEKANRALVEMKAGKIRGAKVLHIG
jgi:propanol-preferring alcohol dehydrogenase